MNMEQVAELTFLWMMQQQMIDALMAQSIVTKDEGNALKNLGRVARKRFSDWGCSQFTIEEMAIVTPDPAIEALRQTTF